MSADPPFCAELYDTEESWSDKAVCCSETSLAVFFEVPTRPNLSDIERACVVPECRPFFEAFRARNPTECTLIVASNATARYLLYGDFMKTFEQTCGVNSSSSSTNVSLSESHSGSPIDDESKHISSTNSTTIQPPSQARGTSTSSSVSVFSIGAIVVLSAIAIIFTSIWLIRRRRRKHAADSSKLHQDTSSHTPSAAFTAPGTAGLENSSTDKSMLRLSDPFEYYLNSLFNHRAFHDHRVDADSIETLEFLGKGGHGIVFLVQLQQSTLLASKRLNPGHTTRRQLQRFIDEVKVTSALKHASIVEFVGVAWTNESDLQVLYEYMKGGELRTYLQSTIDQSADMATASNPSQWQTWKLQFALQIIEGLAYTHSFDPPLIHRDLKSHNVLLTESHQAKISDFGVSRFQSEVGTMTTGVGTSRWMAPEVINGGGDYTESSDIYSFGVILTELDTHAVPYDDAITQSGDGTSTVAMGSELLLMQRVNRGELRPMVSASCPSVIKSLASECLHFESSLRPNALEIAYRLRQLAKEV